MSLSLLNVSTGFTLGAKPRGPRPALPVDRDEWLDDRLADHQRAFEEREDVVTLQEEWLPKSQIFHVVRRVDNGG